MLWFWILVWAAGASCIALGVAYGLHFFAPDEPPRFGVAAGIIVLGFVLFFGSAIMGERVNDPDHRPGFDPGRASAVAPAENPATH